MANTSDYGKIIKHQFDNFCKTVLWNQSRTMNDDNQCWQSYFVSLEVLTPDDLATLCSLDNYEAECIFFTTFDYEIPIENNLRITVKKTTRHYPPFILSGYERNGH